MWKQGQNDCAMVLLARLNCRQWVKCGSSSPQQRAVPCITRHTLLWVPAVPAGTANVADGSDGRHVNVHGVEELEIERAPSIFLDES